MSENIFHDFTKVFRVFGIYAYKLKNSSIITKGKQTLLRLVFNSKEHTFDKKILSKYDWVDCFVCEDSAKVRLNDKEGYINTEGKAICPIMYDETDILARV